MIYDRIIRNEVARKFGALTVVFAFIFLSALLLASGTGIIVELSGSLDRLFVEAKTPHFVQMHSGKINPDRIDEPRHGPLEVLSRPSKRLPATVSTIKRSKQRNCRHGCNYSQPASDAHRHTLPALHDPSNHRRRLQRNRRDESSRYARQKDQGNLPSEILSPGRRCGSRRLRCLAPAYGSSDRKHDTLYWRGTPEHDRGFPASRGSRRRVLASIPICSSEFISYMGVGRSDIRIDLRQAGESSEHFDAVVSQIEADEEVDQFSVLTTSTFTLHHDNGEQESFAVETGDLTVFPLDYLQGGSPTAKDEIALSHLNSNELDKDLGDTLTLSTNGVQRKLRVVGIYQDITNGGRTAKATFSHNPNSIIARTITIDLAPGVSKEKKVAEYGIELEDARVTDLEGYLSQSLSNTISQLTTAVFGALTIGIIVSVLITLLFFRMLITKDYQRIAIMRSIGFSQGAIRIQYLVSSLLLLLFGIGVGTLFSNTLGQRVVSFLWSFMGASRIEFVIDPIRAYILIPLALMAAVAFTTISVVTRIEDRSISTIIAE